MPDFDYFPPIAGPTQQPFFQRIELREGSATIALSIEIISAGDWFRSEVSFSYPVSGMQWMEGVIDLVVGTTSNEIWLIDWKTNQKRGGEPDAVFAADLRKKYLPQLESYRTVLERGFQKPVARLLVYSTLLSRFA